MKIQLWLSHVNNHKNIMGEIQNFPNIEKNVKKKNCKKWTPINNKKKKNERKKKKTTLKRSLEKGVPNETFYSHNWNFQQVLLLAISEKGKKIMRKRGFIY